MYLVQIQSSSVKLLLFNFQHSSVVSFLLTRYYHHFFRSFFPQVKRKHLKTLGSILVLYSGILIKET